MKKYFVIAIALIFAFCGTAFAGAPESNTEVNGYIQFNAASCDFSYSRSIWGWGNDYAIAGGTGSAGGSVENFASAADYRVLEFVGWQQFGRWTIPVFDWVTYPGLAKEDAFGFAFDKTCASTFAWDFGTTSIAGAFVKTTGFAIDGGTAFGIGGNYEWSMSSTYLTGQIGQENYAAEVGYHGSGVEAGNMSGVQFQAFNMDFDFGPWFASSGSFIMGEASTGGMSTVKIDPYGNTRSIEACTFNFAQVNVPAQMVFSNVYGQGFVNGVIYNGSSFGGGNAGFTYNGSNNGFGNAYLNAVVTNYGSSSSVLVKAGSFATVTGSGAGPVN